MTITRVGTNQKYADGWDKAFGGKKKAKAKTKNRAKASASKSGGKKAK